MSSLLDIVQVGDPVLRQRARPLAPADLHRADLVRLIDDMQATMRAAPGVGLAAPQVGHSLQLVVIEDPPSLQARLTPAQLAERQRRPIDLHVLVNPTLTLLGGAGADDVFEAFEGCLSLQGLVMGVTRSLQVRVEALDQHGAEVVLEASGWYARILQHEVDHLHGVLCCDRMDPRTLTTVAQHERLWKLASPAEMRRALETPR
ncbi:MAG: peptide deformylase [Deltaproteobacteria bacterium]|nr:peptide deformylase [Deltaproteobacteria bacterium]